MSDTPDDSDRRLARVPSHLAGMRLDRFLALGALEPRNIRPRNLRMDEFRGGRRPIDLYWRIHNGIAGAPMPAWA